MKKTETFLGRREFPITGNYFELISTVQAVDVEFFVKGGRSLGIENGVSQGLVVERRGLEPFERVAVTTQALEAVSFTYSDGTVTNRSVPSDVSDRAARLLGIVYGTLGQLAQRLVGGVNAAVIVDGGDSYGVSYENATALAANTAVNVLAAASNLAGLRVMRRHINSQHAGEAGFGQSLLAKATAPATHLDGVVLLSAHPMLWTPTTGLQYNAATEDRPLVVPAALRLDFISVNVEQAGARSVKYTILT